MDIMLQLQQDDMFDYHDFSLDRLKEILLVCLFSFSLSHASVD